MNASTANPGTTRWQRQLQAHWQRTPGRQQSCARREWFRFGDASIELVSSDVRLFSEFHAFYGDCADSDPSGAAWRLRCTATVLEDPALVSLHFEGSTFRDPLEIVLGQYRFLRHPPYVETAEPTQGWRALVHAGAPDQLLIASDGSRAFVNLDGAPPELVLDCIVGVAQSAQSGVMFLHAASVGVDGAGALLLGASHAGKSTNALALALRGHAFLGDDVAAVRLVSRSLLPFQKSAGLRAGPLADLLAERVQACPHVRAPGRNGVLRTVVRASALFPDSGSTALPLRYAFLMDGTSGPGRLTAFQPGRADLLRLRDIVIMDTAPAWGLSAGRDLLQLLAVLDLLSGLQCFLVERGSTLGTAQLIENAMRPAGRTVNLASGSVPAL